MFKCKISRSSPMVWGSEISETKLPDGIFDVFINWAIANFYDYQLIATKRLQSSSSSFLLR